ncbi:MAG: DUF6379 domain-containing protein [Bifidobacteriaceae bacterium]|nr:DUF6379 domain-containing protein [Bifidobacteriaceae bacterium]
MLKRSRPASSPKSSTAFTPRPAPGNRSTSTRGCDVAALTDLVVGREPIQRRGETALIPLRVPWYRSLPLSSLETLEVSVEGKPIEDVHLEVNGESSSLAQLAQRSTEYWFVQDTGFVPVPAGDLGESLWGGAPRGPRKISERSGERLWGAAPRGPRRISERSGQSLWGGARSGRTW